MIFIIHCIYKTELGKYQITLQALSANEVLTVFTMNMEEVKK